MMATPAFAFFMDFEEGLGNDGTNIVGVPGVTFTDSAGLPWIYSDVTTGNYNAHSVNTGQSWGTGAYNMYDYVVAWLGTTGDWGRIDFVDQNGTWFQTGVSTYSNVWLEAYNSSGTLIDWAMATNNLYGPDMTFLRVDAPSGQFISYVKIHDTGNYWIVDNMTGDMGGGTPPPPIPEPATLSLLGLGLTGMLVRRFRKSA